MPVTYYRASYFLGLLFVAYAFYRNWGGLLPYSRKDAFILLALLAMGVLWFGHAFYGLIYAPWDYFENPSMFFKNIWKGRSFHGAVIGGIALPFLYARLRKIPMLPFLDAAASFAPFGIFLGRIANFINSELVGRETNLPWGVTFVQRGFFETPRHPSQLYEAFTEGFLLQLIMLALLNRPLPPGSRLALVLTLYSLFRFLVEFTREPDGQLGYYFGFLTMGQLLCLATAACGLGLLHYLKNSQRPAFTTPSRG